MPLFTRRSRAASSLHAALYVLLLLHIMSEGFAASSTREIPNAFGPFINLNASDFAEARSVRNSERIVGTYYDAAARLHILNDDGTDALTTHPPTLDGLSHKSVAWHRQQLEDMIAAGIDVILPVFWGAPSEQNTRAQLHWSYEGLPPLIQAREELLQRGMAPPRIGLFYDTSTLQYNSWNEHQDLTTDRGREWFYATVRDFFSLIPPKHWAMIDDKPIVLLYSAAFAKNHDQSVVDYLRAEFPKQFNGRIPWLAREVSWNVKSDSVVSWGGALGMKNPGGVASVGPGYDHSAVPGRSPLVVDRSSGQFYEEQWIKLLRRPVNFVMIETWNEWHEGTDVAESLEHGRRYIQLTRKYADLFKQGWNPPWPEGLYSRSTSVEIALGATNDERGLRLIQNDDGLTVPSICGGHQGRSVQTGSGKGRYIYFVVDDSFKPIEPASYTLSLQYFDATPGTFYLEFDGCDEKAPFNGAYTRASEKVELTGTKEWRSARFTVKDARFTNAQNQSADLRLVVEAPEFAVRRVTLSR